MAKILLVEDEFDIRELIHLQLETQGGHKVTSVGTGQEALDLLQQEQFELFVIDWMLPQLSGLEVCKFIRHYHPTKKLPILMVTALAAPENIVEALEAGADDYITKPFDMEVLLARTKALLRRYHTFLQMENLALSSVASAQSPANRTEWPLGILKVNTDQCKVWVSAREVSLTVSEYKIVCHLVQNARKVLTRRELVGCVQGFDVHVTERTIDTHISGLRKKLGPASNMIETIRGIGYRMAEEGLG